MEVDQILEQRLFNLSQKDFWIYKLSQVISYHNKTKEEGEDFLDFPTKNEVLDDLEEYVEFISDIINSNNNRTKEDFFDLDLDVEKLTFIREELLHEMAMEACGIIGDADTADDESVERELKKIKIDDNKSFLRNVNKNIISKNNIMKFFSATNFLSKMVSEKEMKNLDYDSVVDSIPEIIRMTYAKLMSEEFGKDVTQKDIDIDENYYEEISEESVRDFISHIIDSVRSVNSSFIKTITFRMIMMGRISITKRRKKGGEDDKA